jgi:hypothetical protein
MSEAKALVKINQMNKKKIILVVALVAVIAIAIVFFMKKSSSANTQTTWLQSTWKGTNDQNHALLIAALANMTAAEIATTYSFIHDYFSVNQYAPSALTSAFNQIMAKYNLPGL